MTGFRPNAIFLAVVTSVAVVGFFAGTREADYAAPAAPTGLVEVEVEGVPRAPSYREERGDDSKSGEVAKSCTDCHDDLVSTERAGTRHHHPLGLPLPRGANLAALADLGARTGTDAEGNATVACRSCHRPHNLEQDARLVEERDTVKLCAACHQDHRPGASQHPVTGTVSTTLRTVIERIGGRSDRLSCLACHDTHDSASATLLRTPAVGNEACRSCHAEQDHALVGGGHGGNDCQDCHGDHERPAHALSTNRAADPQDQYCYECHGPDGEATTISTKKGHPMWKPMTEAMQSTGHEGLVGCRDCHTPHADADKLPFLLTAGTIAKTCTECHVEQASVLGTDHDAAVVAVGDVEESCVSCHTVHGANKPPAAPKGVDAKNGQCLSCHDGRTDATKVSNWSHPAPSEGGEGNAVSCVSCHDPHQWQHGSTGSPGEADGTATDSFLRWQVAVVARCATCHVDDPAQRFANFHGERKPAEAAPLPP